MKLGLFARMLREIELRNIANLGKTHIGRLEGRLKMRSLIQLSELLIRYR
jgi:hypothetical protein